ncbi:DUF2029 domain-containing protein (plasmid) [Halarchaeum sp. CBA1220]|uniref:glycosyltransferase 87 family protein n=1 Tax=Halarchaeum sp. CBA1220 TaxID=1853682 RepID=UPI00131474E1|nr:glycosyltransferase 87 family protein [Halarchaeum sp. CBA1220]QLC34842.1 DUF2029 domain-containing protein [Halarchaeum sp. CBA1220]
MAVVERSRLSALGLGAAGVRRAALFAVYFYASTFLGAFAWNAYDVPTYLAEARAVFLGQEPGGVYPPLFYAMLSAPISFLSRVLPHLADATLLEMSPFSAATVTAYLVGALVLSAALGARLFTEESAQTPWIAAILFNPLVWFVAVVYGQPESLLAMGVIGLFYGVETGRYRVAGLFVSFAAAIKIYPVLLLVPLLVREREHAAEIIEGTVPVFAFLAGTATAYGLSSIYWLSGTPMATATANILGWITYVSGVGWFSGIAPTVFDASLLLVVVLALVVDWEHWEIAYLLPLLPAAYTYPLWLAYRPIPLIVGATYVGLRYESPSARALRWYAAGLTVLCSAIMAGNALHATAAPDGSPWFAGPLAALLGVHISQAVGEVAWAVFLVAVPLHGVLGVATWLTLGRRSTLF